MIQKNTLIKSYSELSNLLSFEDRFNYLALSGKVGVDTFGFDRWFNQQFYRSAEWKRIRDEVIIRDLGCDLGIKGREIAGKIIIHHINPITLSDIENNTDVLMDPENLITTTHRTHNAIHYGDKSFLMAEMADRKPNDTCPWKK